MELHQACSAEDGAVDGTVMAEVEVVALMDSFVNSHKNRLVIVLSMRSFIRLEVSQYIS